MRRTQYVRHCLFGPRVTPRFSNHLFSGIYTRSAAAAAAAAIKATSVVQGHATALKENGQLCDVELFWPAVFMCWMTGKLGLQWLRG